MHRENEYERYFEVNRYTSLSVSTLTNDELYSIYNKLRRSPILVEIVKSFRDLRVKQVLQEQVKLFETEIKLRSAKAELEKSKELAGV